MTIHICSPTPPWILLAGRDLSIRRTALRIHLPGADDRGLHCRRRFDLQLWIIHLRHQRLQSIEHAPQPSDTRLMVHIEALPAFLTEKEQRIHTALYTAAWMRC